MQETVIEPKKPKPSSYEPGVTSISVDELSDFKFCDLNDIRHWLEDRQGRKADRYDEVWEGVYVVSPIADNQHQLLGQQIVIAIYSLLPELREGCFYGQANITDRGSNWTRNFRVPDVAIYLKNNPAEDRGTHWYGGPDFAVEIVSPKDRTRQKLDFYAKVNTRELLIVDRDPWQLELLRLRDKKLVSVGTTTSEAGDSLTSEVLPLKLTLKPGKERPSILISHSSDDRHWTI